MLPPLRFAPIFKSAVWGGRRLASYFPDAPAAGPVSEAWVLSDHGDAPSRVAGGPFDGRSLRDLMATHRRELLGDDPPETFPLLFKFLDAREVLSVQVHPDDYLAQTLFHLPRGKTEAWVVLDAEPGSRIYAGFRPGVDRERFTAAVKAGTASECLHSFEPKAGDCVFLPAGTVHALGAGILAFEVQQTSDTTFRLDDWGRVDTNGQPRPLHVEDGLKCIDFDLGPRRPNWPKLVTSEPVRVEMLAESRYFQLRRYSGHQPFAVRPEGHCRAIVGLDGRVTVNDQTVSAGQVLLLPASLGACECRPAGPFVFLECTPMSPSDVR